LSSRDGSTSTAAAPSQFVALLRNSAEAGDFSSFIAHVRTLSPAAIDLELRAMVVLESAEEGGQSVGPVSDEVQDIGLLLQCLEQELENARNFDMVQALLARVLVVSFDCGMFVVKSFQY
jgi:U3 small nucleolar RNA-associated protein 21